MVLARRYAEEAIELDPEYATGYFVLAGITINEILWEPTSFLVLRH